MEEMMSIKIRKATQTDSLFLAQMILQSSRAAKKVGIFDLIFETSDETVLLQKLESLTKTSAKTTVTIIIF